MEEEKDLRVFLFLLEVVLRVPDAAQASGMGLAEDQTPVDLVAVIVGGFNTTLPCCLMTWCQPIALSYSDALNALGKI